MSGYLELSGYLILIDADVEEGGESLLESALTILVILPEKDFFAIAHLVGDVLPKVPVAICYSYTSIISFLGLLWTIFLEPRGVKNTLYLQGR